MASIIFIQGGTADDRDMYGRNLWKTTRDVTVLADVYSMEFIKDWVAKYENVIITTGVQSDVTKMIQHWPRASVRIVTLGEDLSE